MNEARAKYLSPDDEIKSESSIEALYREHVANKVCSLALSSIADWQNETEEFNDDNRRALELLGSGHCEIPLACPTLLNSEEWLELAEWLSPPTHRTKIIDEEDAKAFDEEIQHLREISPLVKQQKSDDAQLLCNSAKDLNRARKLIGFYDGRCPACAKRRDHSRVAALAEDEATRLNHNIEQYKTKWSEDPKVRLDCLKDL